MLGDKNKDKVIDVLNERLVFERTGVKLYDSLLQKIRAANEPDLFRMVEELNSIREEEAEHAQYLEQKIKSLGGQVSTDTEMAKLIQLESNGIEKVILDGDPSIWHTCHALLAAELVDNAGWDLLAAIADEADDKPSKREFKKRLHEEEEHLLFMRKTVQRFARRNVLGEEVKFPTGPIIG